MTTAALIIEAQRYCPMLAITTYRTKDRIFITAIDDPLLEVHETYTNREQKQAREMLHFILSQEQENRYGQAQEEEEEDEEAD